MQVPHARGKDYSCRLCIFIYLGGVTPFRSTLKALMDLESLDQLALAKLTGFSQSKISRFLSGALVPDRADLVLLVTRISGDRCRRVELLLSFLRSFAEACHGKAGFDGRHYIIRAADESVQNSLGADLELIGEQAVLHADVADMLADLASLLRRSATTEERLHLMLEAHAADAAFSAKPPVKNPRGV